MDRREFLKHAGLTGALAAGAGALGCAPSLAGAPFLGRRRPDVIVIGAGAFGGWTALHLRMLGARVTLIDAWGPGNSRSTSGDETRGIRTSYQDKELWVRWANDAIVKWRAWDETWADTWPQRLFTRTGDLILRDDPADEMIVQNIAAWDALGVAYEVLTPDEIAYRWPQIRVDEMVVGLYEPQAGVARARATCLAVAEDFRRRGGEIALGRAALGSRDGRRLLDVALEPGDRAAADLFVFACGPWLGYLFPDLLGDKLRTPLGYVFYFATPPGDGRFTAPNLPSYNVPGVTGWPALPHDSRGFRVRTGGGQGGDPDTSDRWIPADSFERPRTVLAERFPDLADAPVNETRACHYELSVSRNWIIDRHPDFDNVWIAGGGSAEGFKFGPVLGPYIAGRVLGDDPHPELAEVTRIPTDSFQADGSRR